jgi:hypothetical protein
MRRIWSMIVYRGLYCNMGSETRSILKANRETYFTTNIGGIGDLGRDCRFAGSVLTEAAKRLGISIACALGGEGRG